MYGLHATQLNTRRVFQFTQTGVPNPKPVKGTHRQDSGTVGV